MFSLSTVADWSAQVIKKGREQKQLIHKVVHSKLTSKKVLRNIDIEADIIVFLRWVFILVM